MKILLSNDDGFQAPGIQCLARTLSDIAEVTTIAPDRDRSGASNSLTLDRPLKITEISDNVYSCNGTPTDCVHLALTGFLEQMPDMVVSGINRGYNLGDDVLYSGTAAAAIEGRYLGLPSIAVSLGRPAKNYSAAALVVKDLILKVRQKPLTSEAVLNVNVPDLPLNRLQGYQVTHFGKRHPADSLIKVNNPRGGHLYWIGLPGDAQDDGSEESDFYVVQSGKVSITPFRLDWTSYQDYNYLQQWLKK